MAELTTRAEPARRGARNLKAMLKGRFATQGILVVSAFLIPRVLGAEDFGSYAAVMSIVAIVQSLSYFGLNMVEVRFLAPLWQLGNRNEAAMLGSTIWVTRMALALGAGLVAAAWLVSSGDLAPAVPVLVMLGLLAVFRSSYEATRSLFLPLGEIAAFVSFDVARSALVLITVVATFRLAGLQGVFVGFSLLMAVLMCASLLKLLSVFPLRLRLFRFAMLRRHLGFSLASFAGYVAEVVQQQLAIYLVAVTVTRVDAGLLALTLQILVLLQGIFQSARLALMPILAELEAGAQDARLRYWGGLMMRGGAALSCLACLVWAILGDHVLGWLLPVSFAPVHPAATVILLGVAFYCGAATCSGLLIIKRRPWLAAWSVILYSATTVGGVLWVIREGSQVALACAAIYAGASAIYFVASYLLLALGASTWLSLRRTVLLILPAAAAWPAAHRSATLVSDAVTAVLVAGLYLVLIAALGLIPLREVRQIYRLLLGGLDEEVAP